MKSDEPKFPPEYLPVFLSGILAMCIQLHILFHSQYLKYLIFNPIKTFCLIFGMSIISFLVSAFTDYMYNRNGSFKKLIVSSKKLIYLFFALFFVYLFISAFINFGKRKYVQGRVDGKFECGCISKVERDSIIKKIDPIDTIPYVPYFNLFEVN